MSGFNLADVLGSISNYLGEVKSDKATTEKVQADNAALRQQGIDAIQTAADLSAQAQSYDDQQALEFEKRKAATAQAFQTDILDPENRIAMLAREQAAAVDEAVSRSKRGSELVDMNLWDSPLEYMVARPFADREFTAATHAQQRAQFLDKAITDLNQQTQATVQTQKAINTELTADEVATRAKIAALKATELVRAATMNANTALLDDLKTLRSLDAEGIRQASEGYKLQRHEQEFQARMAELKAAREAREKVKQDEKDGLEMMVQKFNLGAEVMGLAPIRNAAELQQMAKNNKAYVDGIITQGSQVWVDPRTGIPDSKLMRIAPTVGQSVVAMQAVRGRMPATAERSDQLYQQEYLDALTRLKANGNKKPTLDDVANEINKSLLGAPGEGKKSGTVGKLVTMTENAEQDVGKIKNIFRAPDIKVMAAAIPGLAETEGWKQIVEPAAIASGPSPTVDAMFRQAQLAVREKKITPEAAAGLISSYFGTAQRVNNTNEQYFKLGIPEKLYKDAGYKAQVSTRDDSMFGKTFKTIDASNEKQVLHALTLAMTPAKFGTNGMWR